MAKPLTDADPIRLAGSASPRVRSADDAGPVPDSLQLQGITLVLQRSATQEAELAELLAGQENPKSPQYHHWLTPDAFAARFGVAQTDVAAVEVWLQSHGFALEGTSRSRDRITFAGTAAQIRQAFGAELHRFRSGSDIHIAPATDLTLPSDLAGITGAVLHLSDFRPRPTVKALPRYTAYPGQQHSLGPNDVVTMYNLAGLSSARLRASPLLDNPTWMWVPYPQ